MKPFFLIALLGLLFAGSAQSQPGFWRDVSGQPIPESESMQSKNDFAGSLLVTTDEDWEKKWNTPRETTPIFNKAGVVPYGRKIYILTFFANPLTDDGGNANVRCDFKISTPRGQTSFAKQDMLCFSGRIAGYPYPPSDLYLSLPVIGFSGDPDDPAGTWVIEVTLRDANRKVELPLRTTFQLQ